jgi:hypothetical protein
MLDRPTTSQLLPSLLLFATVALLPVACTDNRPDPTAAAVVPSAAIRGPNADTRADDVDDVDNHVDDDVDVGDDVENPLVARANFNAALRGEGHAHGLIKFRQPVDAALIVYLDTRVRGLAPNTSYLLQRAVDGPADGTCTSTSWLTLGKGTQAQAITTDRRGKGHELLFRQLTSAVGSTFDIHFRVIDATTSVVVLQSGCYQYVVSQ